MVSGSPSIAKRASSFPVSSLVAVAVMLDCGILFTITFIDVCKDTLLGLSNTSGRVTVPGTKNVCPSFIVGS